jgi:hypothetical protein
VHELRRRSCLRGTGADGLNRTILVYSRGVRFGSALVPGIAILISSVFVGAQSPSSAADFSGMYSFLKEGEFVQITIEEKGAVSGFISRYGDSESDKGSFLDQFFKSGTLAGEKLNFTTETLHGTWFTFDGVLERGSAKSPQDEGFYVARGTLTRFTTDNKAVSSQARQVEFKSFPRDTSPGAKLLYPAAIFSSG